MPLHRGRMCRLTKANRAPHVPIYLSKSSSPSPPQAILVALLEQTQCKRFHFHPPTRTHHDSIRVPNSRFLAWRQLLPVSASPQSAPTPDPPSPPLAAAAAAAASIARLVPPLQLHLEAHVFARHFGDHGEEELHRRTGIPRAIYIVQQPGAKKNTRVMFYSMKYNFFIRDARYNSRW